MRITVKSAGEKNIYLIFPNFIFMNRCGAIFVSKKLSENGIDIPPKKVSVLLKAIKRYKKKHSDWNLIEATTGDGCMVEIRV